MISSSLIPPGQDAGGRGKALKCALAVAVRADAPTRGRTRVA